MEHTKDNQNLLKERPRKGKKESSTLTYLPPASTEGIYIYRLQLSPFPYIIHISHRKPRHSSFYRLLLGFSASFDDTIQYDTSLQLTLDKRTDNPNPVLRPIDFHWGRSTSHYHNSLLGAINSGVHYDYDQYDHYETKRNIRQEVITTGYFNLDFS